MLPGARYLTTKVVEDMMIEDVVIVSMECVVIDERYRVFEVDGERKAVSRLDIRGMELLVSLVKLASKSNSTWCEWMRC